MASCSRNALSRSEDEAMLRRPDVDEVMEYGRALGFDLTPTEARMIQARMMDTIAALETFDEMRVEERRPPLRFTDRDPGRRPSAVEDPLGAFITRCRVPGAPSGPLHGKTVALKDKIALAGVLVPHAGVLGLEPTMDYVGPMARTVEDIGVSLQVMAGRDGLDPRQADVPATLPPYPAALARGVKGLRIGLLDEGFGVPGGDRAVDEAVMEAVRILERAGARVERVSVPLHTQALPALLPIYLEGGKRMYDTHFGGTGAKTYYPSSLISIFGRLKQSHAREFSPNLKLNLLQGYYLQRNYGGRLYAKAQNVRPTFVAQYDRGFAGVDVLAMPAIPMTPPRGQEPRDHQDAVGVTMLGGKRSLDLGPVIANTCPFNYTGHPAISVPCAKF